MKAGVPEHVPVPRQARLVRRVCAIVEARLGLSDPAREPQSITRTSPNSPTIRFSGFEIAVDDPAAVRVRDGLRDARERVHRAPESPARGRGDERLAVPAAWSSSMTAPSVRPRTSFIVYQIRPSGELTPIVDGDDARVLELRGDLRLDEEATAEVGSRGVLGVEELDGDHAIEERVVRAADLAEGAAGDEAEIFVATRGAVALRWCRAGPRRCRRRCA